MLLLHQDYLKHFKTLSYTAFEIRNNKKKSERQIIFTHKGIHLKNKNGVTIFHKAYTSIKSLYDTDNGLILSKYINTKATEI